MAGSSTRVSARAASTSTTRLQREKVSRAVTDSIADKIFAGTLVHPERIDLDAIAAELGVSRIPIREALSRLEHDGLIRTEYYHGAYVAPLTASVLQDNFQLYGMLTGLAARQVVAAGDVGEVERLAALARAALRRNDADGYFHQSYAYRRELHRAGATERLRHLLANFATVLAAAGRILDENGVREVRKGMRAEATALRSGDPERAARAAFAHMQRNAEVVIDTMRARGVLPPAGDEEPLGDFYERAIDGFAAGVGTR